MSGGPVSALESLFESWLVWKENMHRNGSQGAFDIQGVCISFQGGLKFEDVIKDTIFAQKEQYTDRRATQNGMVSAGALTFRKTSPESWLTRLLLLLVMSAILAMFHLHV